MKKSLKQIITSVCIIGIVILGSQFTAPKKAQALFGEGDIVSDITGEIEGTLGAVAGGVSATANEAIELKDFSLDKIATLIAKQILQQLTLSVINWINSGFNGSPAFVQNPGKFFEGIGDQVAGNFLADNSDLAANLCSPFSIDVRVSLALQVSGVGSSGLGSQYSCSLSNIINNTTNAVKGASINGFVSGDFSQGGWSAFEALTTVPANNPNGAYLQAETNLQAKISTQTQVKQNLLIQGSGFLSSETCTSSDDDDADDDSDYSDDSGQDCEIQTPGSSISNALNKSLGVPTDELELANDINAVINAAFSQLVLVALKSGLGAISGSSGSGVNTAYVQQIQSEQTAQLQTVQANTVSDLSPYLANAQQVAQNTQIGLTTVLAAQNTLDNVQACYTNDINSVASSSSVSIYSAGIAYAQGQINQVADILSTQVAPLAADSLNKYNAASSSVQSLDTLDTNISGAQDATGLDDPSQQIQALAEAGSLPSSTDAQQSLNDLSTLQSTVSPIQSDANNRLSQCGSFDIKIYGISGTTY